MREPLRSRLSPRRKRWRMRLSFWCGITFRKRLVSCFATGAAPRAHIVTALDALALRLAHAPGEDERVVHERVLLAARHEQRREAREEVGRREDGRELVVGLEVGVAVRPDEENRHRAHLVRAGEWGEGKGGDGTSVNIDRAGVMR